jgi:hypothetical protein
MVKCVSYTCFILPSPSFSLYRRPKMSKPFGRKKLLRVHRRVRLCVYVGESLCVYCVSVLSSYTSMHIILSHTRSQYTPHNTLYTGALASRQALHTPPQQATVDRTRVVWNLPLLCRSPAWLTVRVCKCECGCMSVTHGPLWIYTFTHIHRRLVFGWFLVQWCLGYMYIHTPMHQHVLTWRDSMSNYYDTPDVCRWLSRYEV